MRKGTRYTARYSRQRVLQFGPTAVGGVQLRGSKVRIIQKQGEVRAVRDAVVRGQPQHFLEAGTSLGHAALGLKRQAAVVTRREERRAQADRLLKGCNRSVEV